MDLFFTIIPVFCIFFLAGLIKPDIFSFLGKKKNRKDILKCFTGVFLFLVIFFFFNIWGNFFPIESVGKKEAIVFNEDFLKNAKINIYCSLRFKEGNLIVENLRKKCGDNNLPAENFTASFLDIEFLKGERAVGLIKAQVGESPADFQLIDFHRKEGTFFSLRLEKEAVGVRKEGEMIKINFQDGGEEYYRVFDNFFLSFTEETKKIASPELGFQVEIPKNWETEKVNGLFYFYHPDAKDTHKVLLEGKSLKKSEDFPYKKEYQLIKGTLRFNELQNLPDYRSLRDGIQDYLEVNTVKDKIIYFREGEEEKSFNILAIGTPGSWNTTPAGIYNVSKRGLRFSTESEVYMPYSISIYGKYLIHGEAYFPSGEPYLSEFSGGCVRVKNEEMKELYKIFNEDHPVLIVTHEKTPFLLKTKGKMQEFPEITAESYLVADMDSGKVFIDKKPRKKLPIASITKMMTALIPTERMSVNTTITIRDYMLTGHGNTEGIYDRRRVTMGDLLPPMIIESSNNAAKVMAHFFGKDNNLIYMNKRTENIGMKNTVFVEPSGLQKENVSTAEDIYYLAYYLLNNRKPILEVSRGADVPYVNYNTFPNITTRNPFYGKKGYLGGKTGFINSSKHTGFFIFQIEIGDEKREIFITLLGSNSRGDMESEVYRIKEWLKNSYY